MVGGELAARFVLPAARRDWRYTIVSGGISRALTVKVKKAARR